MILDDRYELSKELGRGSTGTVWEAWDRHAEAVVAVKVWSPHVLQSPQARRRFLREAEAMRVLSHRHLVQVIAHATTADGGAYLVMERLVGTTFAARLRDDGPLPQLRAIKIASEILEAVAAAHRLNVVHRDLKPGNVMLVEHAGDPDFVKVCDFGLAKAIDPESESEPGRESPLAHHSIATEQGAICGTPEYMAPEQARGEPVDARADLYAVAVMLYHAVVGQLPFSGRSALAVVSQHLSAPPPRPSAVRPDLGIFPALESLILRGLAKHRTERPSSAEVFRADLRQIERDIALGRTRAVLSSSSAPLDGDTLSLAPSSGERTAHPRARAVAALGFTAIALGVVSIAWWKNAGHTAGSPPSPSDWTATAATDRVKANAARVNATQTVTTSPANVAETRPLAPTDANAPNAPNLAKPAARAVEKAPNTAKRPPSGVLAASLPAPPKPAARPHSLLDDAESALRDGRISEACALGQTAAAGSPTSPSVWKFLGRCSMRLGDRQRAVGYYRRYLELAPESPDAVFIRKMIE